MPTEGVGNCLCTVLAVVQTRRVRQRALPTQANRGPRAGLHTCIMSADYWSMGAGRREFALLQVVLETAVGSSVDEYLEHMKERLR